MNYIKQLLVSATLLLSFVSNAQCDILFMSKDTKAFDCKARIVAYNGEPLNTYDIPNQIAVFQPTCNTNSSYVYSFYRNGVLLDRVVAIRIDGTNEFKITQEGEGMIRVEMI